MGNKTHRTANGQEIDMQNIILKNAKVRAVGNMNVNARGDVIDNVNETTSERSTQVNRSYRKQTGNIVKDTPVATSKKAVEETIVGLDDIPVAEEVTPVKAKTKSIKTAAKTAKKEPASGGLASAIAKAESKDE